MISVSNHSLNPAFYSTKSEAVIEPTFSTPYIRYEVRSNYLVIKGRSTGDHMNRFYHRIINEFKTNVQIKKLGIIHLNLLSINTSTAKVLFDLFRFLRDAQLQGAKFGIQWDVSGSELDMIETARDFAELFDLKIKIK